MALKIKSISGIEDIVVSFADSANNVPATGIVGLETSGNIEQVVQGDKLILIGKGNSQEYVGAGIINVNGNTISADMDNYYTVDEINYFLDEKYDTSAFKNVSGTFLTAHQPISADEWNSCYETVSANSATWMTETDWTDDINAASAYALDEAKTWVENQNYITGVDLSNYYTKSETSGKTEITNALTAKQNVIQSKKNSSLPYLETSNGEPSWEVIENEQINAHGTAQEGEVYNTTINGRTYTMVCLNGKLWLAENYVDEAKDIYTDSKYGSYFTEATIKLANFVPQGWHLPSKEEYQELIDYTENHEKYLATTDWHTLNYQGNPDPNYIAGTNELKLNILPGGEYYNSTLHSNEYMARFWTNTDEIQRIYVRVSNYIGSTRILLSFDMSGPGSQNCYNVRLIKDDLDVSGPDCWKTFKGKNFMAIADNEGNTFKDFYLKKVEAQATYQPIGSYASSAGVETLNTYYALTTTGWKDIAEGFYNKTSIDNSLSLKQDNLLFAGENNTITAINNSAVGTTDTGAYVPLSARECIIGNNNTATQDSFAQGSTNSSYYWAFTQGSGNSASYESLSQGVNNYAHNYSLAVGSSNSGNERGIAIGINNTANFNSLTIGSSNSAAFASLSLGQQCRTTTASFALGTACSATLESFAQGDSCSATNNGFAQGSNCYAEQNSFAQGKNVSAKYYCSLAQGYNVSANYDSFAQGNSVTAAETGCAQGLNVTALSGSFAQGINCSAQNYSLAQGNNVTAAATGCAQGLNVTALSGSFAQGINCSALRFSLTQGLNNTAVDYSIAAGQTNSASAWSTSIGSANTAQNYSFAQGKANLAQNYSFAQGESVIATGQHSHAEGYQTTAQGTRSHAEGYHTIAEGSGSHAEGQYTYAYSDFTHAEGSYSYAEGGVSHAEGGYTTAVGYFSHTEGYSTKASGEASHAEGESTSAIGNYSHTEGYGTYNEGDYSHAEGYYTTAEGDGSHAEGSQTSAFGDNSHTEGSGTSAEGDNSHAEGWSTIALGGRSHTEGYGTSAYGNDSHAEGSETIASGYATHAEGSNTVAKVFYAHAEGDRTSALGKGSHAEGWLTIADDMYMHAQGRCNKTSAHIAFVIGNGNVDNDNVIHRSDAFIVDWNGVASAVNLKTSAGQVMTEPTLAAGKQYSYTTTGWHEFTLPEVPTISAENGITATTGTGADAGKIIVGIDTTNYKLLTTAEYNDLVTISGIIAANSGRWVLTPAS